MKRVYSQVTVAQGEQGFSVLLDQKALRSPGRRQLCLPTEAMARAIALEWDSQGDQIDPAGLRLTKLAGRVADLSDEARPAIESAVVAYVETDLVCYRADGPADLIAQQSVAWDPLLEWAKRRFAAAPRVTTGIIPISQDVLVAARYGALLKKTSVYQLIGLQVVTAITSSLIIALAVYEAEIDAEKAWQMSQIDENYGVSRWGDDPEAEVARVSGRADLEAAVYFIALDRGSK